ncbi:MAG: tRNA 2-thiocytidine(32) synthetase TtcA [Proteobacteria bacterium]|nr:tRNA 2-thiocytidine(32) synthetase TtcA [Pseudomonadota bacterium]
MASRVEKKLLNLMGRASKEFALLEPNDRVMVCVSGGKDSFAMLNLLRTLIRRLPFSVELIAVNLDQKQPGFPVEVLPNYFEAEGYDYRVIERDTYSVVTDKIEEGKTYCSLCSRLRRGILYSVAVELGCTKIALGHHREDAIETLLLNLFYSGQIKAMPPRLRSDDGRNVVIRPLIYCAEADIAAFAEEQAFPIIPCNLCGSQENLKRKQVRQLIETLHADNDKVKGNLFASLSHVRATHLMDPLLRSVMGLDDARGRDEGLDAIGASGDIDDCGLSLHG